LEGRVELWLILLRQAGKGQGSGLAQPSKAAPFLNLTALFPDPAFPPQNFFSPLPTRRGTRLAHQQFHHAATTTGCAPFSTPRGRRTRREPESVSSRLICTLAPTQSCPGTPLRLPLDLPNNPTTTSTTVIIICDSAKRSNSFS
jgi:hypothetical protein